MITATSINKTGTALLSGRFDKLIKLFKVITIINPVYQYKTIQYSPMFYKYF